LVEWDLEQKCCYSSTGPGIAHVFGDAFSDDFTFLYSLYVFGKKKSKYFYAKRSQMMELFCGSDFEKFRLVGCDAIRVLRHQISPEYR